VSCTPNSSNTTCGGPHGKHTNTSSSRMTCNRLPMVCDRFGGTILQCTARWAVLPAHEVSIVAGRSMHHHKQKHSSSALHMILHDLPCEHSLG
jgi:hypothetical protein